MLLLAIRRRLPSMTNSDTSILLRSLAKLIEKPEIKAFQSSLTKTMNSIIVADSIMLYEIRMLKQVASECAESFLVPVGCEDALVEDQAAPTLLSQQPQFEEALRTTAVVTRQVGDAASPVVRSIYPIHGAR